ncbi:sulfite exporter TauE/SafE family protein [Siculibacillus lacustris]|uniref:Probable membrane transporter protein n=1 Tax=Siculibacillus lacustris TaxID=1549641 RepID=A0A4Q9VVI1_9HYPH|nr:sulfite exporter TauE/SafE family protein [Siculibacillus lacustris]TBW39817.1 sulfite exporter TauE/SafE family protein [Siculibacillus lacustris]
MTPIFYLLGAGLLAGAMNALAGGGSFVSLPALIAAGLPSVEANASSTVALFPGGAASIWVYRDGIRGVCGVSAKAVVVTTALGGLVGALALLWTSSTTFDRMLPWLLLLATVVLTFGPRLGARLRGGAEVGAPTVLIVQALLGVYGGFFGGAVGLMMMAAWSLFDGGDLKSLNPSRTVMVTAANAVAVVCFALAGAVRWPETLALAAGAVVGGWLGAHLGRRLPAQAVRVATLTLAMAMTVLFFWRAA